MSSLFTELKRRNVFRVGIAYLIVAWLLMQVADVMIENIGAPDWVFKAILLVLAIGFPLVLLFAWAFEMTPEGLKREKDVDRSQSITAKTGRKLDFTIIAVLAVALGYFIWEARFAGAPAPDAATTEDSAAGRAADGAAPAAARAAIAVLPFANRSRLEDDLFFTDGIHDDLLTQLAKLEGLKVISRTSVMEYRDTTKKIPEIAAELGVGKILEGGVQRAGNRIRINAQLIDVETDEHLWAETFDREMTLDNLFDIQSEITRQIVTAIRGELSEQELDSLTERPTDSLPAWEAYLKAKAATLRPDYTMEKYLEAEDWAQRAVNIDPGFAEAWAMLAEVHGQAVWMGWDNTPHRRTDAQLAKDRAVALKPDSAVVMNAQADYFYRIEHDYARALSILQAANAQAPGDARILFYLAVTQRRLGQLNEAALSMQRSIELDPANLFTVSQLADTYLWLQAWDELEQLADTWLARAPDARDLKATRVRGAIRGHGDLELARRLLDELDPWTGNAYVNVALELPLLERDWDRALQVTYLPEVIEFHTERLTGNDAYVLLARGTVHALQGEHGLAEPILLKAVNQFGQFPDTGPINEAFNLSAMATAYAHLGDMDQALARSTEATRTLTPEMDFLFGSNVANRHTWIMARAGQRDEALARLSTGLGQPAGYARWTLALDPEWDFFRDDERFNALVEPEGGR